MLEKEILYLFDVFMVQLLSTHSSRTEKCEAIDDVSPTDLFFLKYLHAGVIDSEHELHGALMSSM